MPELEQYQTPEEPQDDDSDLPPNDAPPEDDPQDAGGEPEQLYAGKYRSVDDLENGYSQLLEQMNRERAERGRDDEMKRLFAEMRAAQAPPQADPSEAEKAVLKEAGLDDRAVDALLKLVDYRTDSRVPQTTQSLLAPLLNQGAAMAGRKLADQQAIAEIFEQDPDFQARYNDLVSSPLPGAAAAGKTLLDAALRLHSMNKTAADAASVQKASRREAKRAAGISSPRGDSRAPKPQKTKAEETAARRQAAMEAFDKHQDVKALANDLLRGELTMWTENGEFRKI